MRWAFALLLLGLATELAISGGADTDQKKIQGTWQAVEAYKGKEKAPEKELVQAKLRFEGDKVVAIDRNREEKPAPFTLDPTKNPKHLDLTPPSLGRTILAIYQLDGDQLTIALGSPDQRPKDFNLSETGFVLKLRREKQ